MSVIRVYASSALAIWLLFALLTAGFLPTAFGQAASPAIITDLVVRDPNGNDVSNEPLVAGGEYTVTFSIAIGATLVDRILLTTNLERTRDVFWTLESNYDGVDLDTWTPGSPAIDFEARSGTADFTLTGRIPEFITEKFWDENGRTIHAIQRFQLLIVSLDSNKEILDLREASITDQIIIRYGNLLQEKRTILDSVQMDPQYAALARSILAESEGLTAAGYYDAAITLLESIPSSGFPTPPVVTNIFLGSTLGLAAISVILVLLFLRANRGKGFISRRVEDEAKKLDLLLVKATRVDKALSTEIETIKRELQDLVE